MQQKLKQHERYGGDVDTKWARKNAITNRNGIDRYIEMKIVWKYSTENMHEENLVGD